ncbi:MAG: ArsR family transcriptional regulator, lead/cadmium/zinc/bismuth-responsive transcriptional [Clostridia bacterium]|nr:cadC [Clostridiales bacterium]MDK2984849.1 ArsR family transcriptional regulator, lead/cadmium/zinc/bismuth-responsive transcriptional [Clostridia bacterium]
MSSRNDVCEEFCVTSGRTRELKENIPRQTVEMASLFKVLGDETRAKILYLLTLEKELCVCDIAEILDSSLSNISHHLRLLRAHRLVKYRKAGKNVFYSLDDIHVVNMIKEGFEHASHIINEE